MGISYITVHGYEFIIDTDDWSNEEGRSIAEDVLEERLRALTPEQAAKLHADLLDLEDEIPPLARDISKAAFEAGTAGWWRKPTSGHNTEIGAAPVLDKNIIIVNDGNFRWGADRAELEAAMRNLGWEQEGRYWIEPEGDESDDNPGAEYTRLCDIVQPLPGMDGANNDWQEPEEGAWDDLPTLTWVPHVSRRHWLVEG